LQLAGLLRLIKLSQHLHDPAYFIFGAQIGIGTNIKLQIKYLPLFIICLPDNVLVLINNLTKAAKSRK
jgi:hypothetical protein